MYCPICGKLNSSDAEFCINCLADLKTGRFKHCPSCGFNQNKLDAPSCANCGRELGVIVQEQHPIWDPEPHEEMKYAGFWRRFAAIFIDGIVILILGSILMTTFGVAYVVILGEDYVPPEEINAALGCTIMFYVFILFWLYFTVLESSFLQATLGKMALGIIVTDLEGKRIGFGRATGRYFGKTLSFLLFFIGFLIAAAGTKKQALHDILAGTLVITKQ